MIRTVAFTALTFLLVGCAQFQSRESPFGTSPKATKSPPPPYGSVPQTTVSNGPVVPANVPSSPPRIAGNQSPLGIASAPAATALVPPPSDQPLVSPPNKGGIAPAGGPQIASTDDASEFPPFRRRPDPRPDVLPSPYALKDPVPAPKAPAKGPAPMANAPAVPSPAAKNLGELKALLATANAAWKNVDTYEVVITRREINAKGDQNNEVVICQYRREPMGVFMRTISDAGKGREIVYTRQSDKMHVMLGEGDNRFVRAGFLAPPIGPDDPRVKEKSRYSIREAGLGRYISVLNSAVTKLEAGRVPPDAVIYDGEVKRTEYPYPLVGVTHKVRAGDEPLMPNGGVRSHFFDMKKDSPSFGLPVLVIAIDAGGKELEYYKYDKFKSPAGLTDADFDPARLGKKK